VQPSLHRPPLKPPLPLQVVRFLKHLLATRFKDASNPSGALDNVRKLGPPAADAPGWLRARGSWLARSHHPSQAMGHLRAIQRDIPNAHDLSK
jgi:hypothetical protein